VTPVIGGARHIDLVNLAIEQSPLPKATVFTEAERAALALTEEGTRLADAHHGVGELIGGRNVADR
jgi:hypothetical protein